jgi:ATP-dependent DNA ligase
MLQRGGRARYAVFDCVFLNGDDLRHETLTVRRAALEKEISENHELIFCLHQLILSVPQFISLCRAFLTPSAG